MKDRYAHLTAHADTGLGADELHIRRFTRPSEKTPVRTAKHITEVSTNPHERN